MATYLILFSALAILFLLFGHSGRTLRGNWVKIDRRSNDDVYAEVYRRSTGRK